MSDFRFYKPSWIGYEEAPSRIARLFEKAIGSKLQDITGVVSQYGWEPDWPIVLRFSSVSISFATKCCNLWSIDEWGDDDGLRKDINDEGLPLILSERSLVQLLDLRGLVGTLLRSVYWPAVRGYGVEQCFVLTFAVNALRIYEAGDQLGLEVLTGWPESPHSARIT